MNNIKFTELANFQDKQLQAWYTLMDPKCKYLLYGGAASGGKSYFLRWAAIGLGMYYFSKYGLRNVPIGLFSQDYPTLKDRQVIKMKNEIPPFLGSLRESRDEGYAFIGAPEYGSFLVLLRNLDDPSKYKSAEFAAVLVEELTENTVDTFDDLRFRMRYGSITDVKFIGATNPGGIGHGFVKKKWVKPDMSDPDSEQDRFFFVQGKYSDNKYTTDEYVKQLAALPEDKRRAYMDGDWDVFAGQYFQEWRDNLHIINPFIPDKNSVIVGGMDWGRVDSFAFYLTEVTKINYNGGHFYRSRVFMEVYGTEKTPEEWSKTIKERLKGYSLELKDISWIRADTQIYSKSIDAKALDIYTQFVQSDPEWRRLKPANKDRIGGWENLHRWFSIAPDGLPYLQFASTCTNAIRTLPDLVHDENKVEDVSNKGEDHAGDSIRYLHMALKWIEGNAGAVIHPQPGSIYLPNAPRFIGPKQVSIDLDAWAPGGTQGGEVGGVTRQ